MVFVCVLTVLGDHLAQLVCVGQVSVMVTESVRVVVVFAILDFTAVTVLSWIAIVALERTVNVLTERARVRMGGQAKIAKLRNVRTTARETVFATMEHAFVTLDGLDLIALRRSVQANQIKIRAVDTVFVIASASNAIVILNGQRRIAPAGRAPITAVVTDCVTTALVLVLRDGLERTAVKQHA